MTSKRLGRRLVELDECGHVALIRDRDGGHALFRRSVDERVDA
jgi:hypothetical protein